MSITLSDKSIEVLTGAITGDAGVSHYQRGVDLVKFFNRLGFTDEYAQPFPSRRVYAEVKLRELNGSNAIARVFTLLVDVREYATEPEKLDALADHLNVYLELDGYRVKKLGRGYHLADETASGVVFTNPLADSVEPSHVFIREQLEKCEVKINEGDYDGAITNARSLVESVFVHVQSQLDPAPPDHGGDLIKLYKHLQKLLHLGPERRDISDSLRQLLSGLTSIVNGIAAVRNRMGDAHAAAYRPARHHAKLAVNAAKTLVDFVFETYEYQLDSGSIVALTSGSVSEMSGQGHG